MSDSDLLILVVEERVYSEDEAILVLTGWVQKRDEINKLSKHRGFQPIQLDRHFRMANLIFHAHSVNSYQAP